MQQAMAARCEGSTRASGQQRPSWGSAFPGRRRRRGRNAHQRQAFSTDNQQPTTNNQQPTTGLDPCHFAPNSAMAAAKALPTHFQAEPIQ